MTPSRPRSARECARTARGSIPPCRSTPTPRCRAATCWRSAPTSIRWSRSGMRSSRTCCRFRSISGQRCACGTRSISARVNTSPTRKSPPRGIGELFWSMGQVIAAPVTRRNPSWGAIRPANTFRAPPCKDGSRPTSPTTAGAGSAIGPSTTSPPICGRAITARPPPPDRWRRKSPSQART